MKKTLIALCGALSLAAFAEPADPAPCPEGRPCPPIEAGARPHRRMQKPTMLMINEKTTPEDIAAFKNEVSKKIEESLASYAAKPDNEKQPVRLVLFSNDGMGRGRGPGMGQRGGEGRGPRADRPHGKREGEGCKREGEGRGPRGNRPHGKRGGEGNAPMPPAEEIQ